VLVATIAYGIRARGLVGYLKTFAEPTWVMIPLNLVEQITRSFSLIIRLFGNVMSGSSSSASFSRSRACSSPSR
jgi:F-type H+-transporting ATPase subunit a